MLNVDVAIHVNPVAYTSTSSGYSTPSWTTPRSLIFDTPTGAVSTRWTCGRLNVGRYSSWNVGRLHPYG